jgi:hypothetical protein
MIGQIIGLVSKTPVVAEAISGVSSAIGTSVSAEFGVTAGSVATTIFNSIIGGKDPTKKITNNLISSGVDSLFSSQASEILKSNPFIKDLGIDKLAKDYITDKITSNLDLSSLQSRISRLNNDRVKQEKNDNDRKHIDTFDDRATTSIRPVFGISKPSNRAKSAKSLSGTSRLNLAAITGV